MFLRKKVFVKIWDVVRYILFIDTFFVYLQINTITQMEYKVCYKCRKKLPLTSEYFAKQKKSADGYDGRCKSCVNLISKKYREKKGEQYRVDNISKAKEQQLSRLAKGQCRHCSSERLENSDSFCEKHWFEYVAKAHLGTMKRGNELKKILELQDYRCTYTGIKLIPALNASIDHKIPLSTDVSQYQKIENLQWVCLDINIMKRNHSEDDFLKYIKLIYENRF